MPHRAANAKDTVVGATATARDTVTQQAQATMNDVQGLSASAQQAVNDSNGHPLAKYHSVGLP
jgi:outer membrane lipoprotein-sorting protein